MALRLFIKRFIAAERSVLQPHLFRTLKFPENYKIEDITKISNPKRAYMKIFDCKHNRDELYGVLEAVKRLVVAGQCSLGSRRHYRNPVFPENKITEDINKIPGSKRAITKNIDQENNRSVFYKVLDAHANEETAQCCKFADEDEVNAARFADECTVSSYKFAYDDTVNAAKLVDEDTVGCARFAVDEIARAKKTNIEFVRVLKSSRIPSWSHEHQIILEAVINDTGEKSWYYAEVQSQPWMEEEPFKLITWMSE